MRFIFLDGLSQNVACILRSPIIGSVNGRQTFPITKPSSPTQKGTTGKLLHPICTYELNGMAGDPEGLEHTSYQPIINPVTTSEEILGADKKVVNLQDVTWKATAASIKSTKILSKFWGEDLDSDSNVEPEADTVNHADNILDTSLYLTTPSVTGKKGKRGRPKKPKAPNKQAQDGTDDSNQTEEQHHHMESAHTRSKAGSQNYNTNITQ